MTNFSKITVCLDMSGCPNRCRHCWLGHTPNDWLGADDLRFVATAFRPFTDNLEVASWFREPDFLDNYKELWLLENELSDSRTAQHWELCSFWRAVRDAEYVPWLASLGVKACQLTLFGGREKTDYYAGRKGAYDEIVKTIDILLENDIAPRIQAFAFKDNVDDLQSIEDLIAEKQLIERCAAIGTPFTAFVHQGSCDGENSERNRLYELRVTADDIAKIPPLLAEYSLKHWNANTLEDIFGPSERELVAELSQSTKTQNMVLDAPTFYVDGAFNVYPNRSEPSPYWRLGNLKVDGAEKILDNYANNRSAAQHALLTVTLGEMVRKCGAPDSLRLFDSGDYEMYVLGKYLESEGRL